MLPARLFGMFALVCLPHEGPHY